jgi:hypothetical protein
MSYCISHNTHRSFTYSEPVDQFYGVKDPDKAWSSGKYLARDWHTGLENARCSTLSTIST